MGFQQPIITLYFDYYLFFIFKYYFCSLFLNITSVLINKSVENVDSCSVINTIIFKSTFC